MVPSITERSEWHTPAASMRTCTSLGPGPRTSSASVTSTPSPGVDDASHLLAPLVGDDVVGAPAAWRWRSSRLSTFPLAFTGSASTSTTLRGTL